MLLYTNYIAFFAFMSLHTCYHGLAVENHWERCETVVVDELNGLNCSDNLWHRQNITCSSIKDTLELISKEPFINTSCVEVIINQGQYLVEGSIIISRNVYIRGRNGHSVRVHLETQGSDPPEFLYSLSFRNTDYVCIGHIEFTGSEGVIGFDNVSRVEVANSSFRSVAQYMC